MANAVRATTGMELVAAIPRRRPSAVTPSMSGSWISIRMRSGTCCSARAIAAAAVSASSVRKPSCWRRSRASFRFLSLSSTMRIRAPAIARSRRSVAAEAAYQLDELGGRERRLGGEMSDVRGEPLALLGCDVLRSEDHNGDVRRGRFGSQPLDDFEAVGLGHQQIEDDDVGLLGS